MRIVSQPSPLYGSPSAHPVAAPQGVSLATGKGSYHERAEARARVAARRERSRRDIEDQAFEVSSMRARVGFSLYV